MQEVISSKGQDINLYFMANLRIGNYFDMPAVNYEQTPPLTWRDFYGFRNQVLRVLRSFGSAGPMGEVDLSKSEDSDDLSFEDKIIENPDFFVVDDMYNEHDKRSIIECDPAKIVDGLFDSLGKMMRDFPGWFVSFSLGDSGLIVFSDIVLAGGRRFWDCASVQDIVARCSKVVDFGGSEQFSEAMYELWLKMIEGQIASDTQFPAAPSRQWHEVIYSLQRMLAARGDGGLTSFDYDQVRHDLHPATKRQFLARLLEELSMLSCEELTAARRNIQQDSAQALAETDTPEHTEELANQINRALFSISLKIEKKEIVNWWVNILSKMEDSPPWQKRAIEDTLRRNVQHLDPLIQLSSLFGLARLGVSNISSHVDDAIRSHPEWKENPGLLKWLEKIVQGGKNWPDKSIFSDI